MSYNISAIDSSSATTYFTSVNDLLDKIPAYAFLALLYFTVMYYARDNGIYKSNITASAVTTLISMILAMVGFVDITIMFIPLGLLILGILLSVFVGER